MIATVGLFDVQNCEAFVGRALTSSRIRMTGDEREEMLCEGLLILAELAAKFEQHRDGYATSGRFSGYAAKMLPLRMQDAYDRLHPEHQVTRDSVSGARVYDFNPAPMSIFADDFGDLTATALLGNPSQVHHDLGATVDAALNSLPAWDRFAARRVVMLIDEGYGTDEIANRLGLGRKDVSRLQSHTASAIARCQLAEADEAPWPLEPVQALTSVVYVAADSDERKDVEYDALIDYMTDQEAA